MSNDDVYDGVFRRVFGKEDCSGLRFSMDGEWESIRHMELVAEIERAFNIRMDTDDIIDFSDYPTGKRILKGYGVVFERV